MLSYNDWGLTYLKLLDFFHPSPDLCIALLNSVRPLSEPELLAKVKRMEEAYRPIWIWISLEQDILLLCISEQAFWAGKAYKKVWLKHAG